MSYSFFTAAAFTASLVLGAGSVHAQEDTSQETVRFADLDLSTAAGGQALMARIRSAAGRVCGPAVSPMDALQWGVRSACMRHGVAGAVADAHSPMLTAIHEGRPLPPTIEVARLSPPTGGR